jgi:hypothetical protein
MVEHNDAAAFFLPFRNSRNLCSVLGGDWAREMLSSDLLIRVLLENCELDLELDLSMSHFYHPFFASNELC